MAYNKQDDMALDPELVELAAGNKAKKGKGKEAEKPAPVVAAEVVEVKVEEAPKPEPKVACFISRKEYPISETVELKYKNQTVRVAKSFVKFQLS